MLLLLVFLGLLLTPLVITVDSTQNCYEVALLGFGNAKVVPKDGSIFFQFQVFFWKKEVDPIELLLKRRKKKKKAPDPKKLDSKKKKKTSKLTAKTVFRKIRQVMNSFKVSILYANIDTGNNALNAYYYPFYYWLNRHEHATVNVNFTGENVVVFKARNQLIRILYAILR